MKLQMFNKVQLYQMNTVVVGTGAAGFNAADQLWALGQKDIAIVTDHVGAGTSRNTGSDKQTYYKLTLCGNDPDSVGDMAETLFSGQCMDGDIALCEAALSARCFLKLVNLGVNFPQNKWGEFVGYKTDHDPRCRATSVGPYTSKQMTECLEQAVREKNIKIFDRMQVIKILSDGERVYGLLCLNLSCPDDEERRFVLFSCKNIVFATGGPAGMYADSVYPAGHYGSSGLAFEAGAKGKNLTEWQYGIASIHPRWNVSGTYMQVLPRFFSTDENGNDEREFLMDFFENRDSMLSSIFLKGYQWPFDVRKLSGGSSIIDILVYMERSRGRRIFLDFRENPGREPVNFENLDQEAFEYLNRAGACYGTPIERLSHMNMPAVEFYLGRGVDLRTEPLEIAVCAQHNNGGLAADAWWHTDVEGLFAAGEVCGSHGVYRPGGSALNSGQVGSARAAQYIAARRQGEPDNTGESFEEIAGKAVYDAEKMVSQVTGKKDGRIAVRELWNRAAVRMSRFGAAIRNPEKIELAIKEVQEELSHLGDFAWVEGGKELWRAFRLRDMLISQFVYLSAMKDYVDHQGRSRGSALYTDLSGQKPDPRLLEEFTFCLDDGSSAGLIQEASYRNGKVQFEWRKVRTIPEDDNFFENVWRQFRENQNIY
ncbi:FAD-binding protein [Lacrimispora sphenoides]|uniref:Succinate dehydrogenase/fumarate reductase, flavoprotein subunit n=1 Tax=Lacrimispora sphenoides JCM 1415 TaxID=1297793 RepID=A0ABY1C3R9_9FIRM|nr:FAD-binding protein [Lacrimispora sphenoides]SET61893.1 Succinate dehydrogenase/fumarate reductase, flavoprotein subunit [[Clostridium] sphenoides JCM 1415]SUY50094.1 fumarate reductase/succinate dehydrogenase flavoprotein domain protein [Lacrimispora sphenoides]